jgi:hypothetical protein
MNTPRTDPVDLPEDLLQRAIAIVQAMRLRPAGNLSVSYLQRHLTSGSRSTVALMNELIVMRLVRLEGTPAGLRYAVIRPESGR